MPLNLQILQHDWRYDDGEPDSLGTTGWEYEEKKDCRLFSRLSLYYWEQSQTLWSHNVEILSIIGFYEDILEIRAFGISQQDWFRSLCGNSLSMVASFTITFS